jgi:hypothetical protein
MGFPPNERSVRLLSKVRTCRAEMVGHLHLLRELLRWEPSTWNILDRTRYITEKQLTELAVGRKIAWADFTSWESIPGLSWFFQLPAAERHWLASQYVDIPKLDEIEKAFMEPLMLLPRFRGVRKAASYLFDYKRRRKAIQESKAQLSQGIDTFGWPNPPIPPTRGITPVISFVELEQVGRKMHNCIATYAPRILFGDYYVYLVEGPCPCAVGICYTNGAWKIDQIECEDCKPPPDRHTSSVVEDWLQSAPPQERNSSIRKKYLQAISKLCGLPLRCRRK